MEQRIEYIKATYLKAWQEGRRAALERGTPPSTPRFKVGDRVLVSHAHFKATNVYTVAAPLDDFGEYKVEYDGHTYYFRDDQVMFLPSNYDLVVNLKESDWITFSDGSNIVKRGPFVVYRASSGHLCAGGHVIRYNSGLPSTRIANVRCVPASAVKCGK